MQVTDSFNQLKIEIPHPTYGSVEEYYKYATIKSLSTIEDSNGDFSVIVNFIANDKDNPLVLNLGSIGNQVTWTNDAAGANNATTDISEWMHTDNPSTNVTVEGWTAPLGQQTEAASIPVVLPSDQTGQTGRVARIERATGAGSTPEAYSVSFANVHASDNVTVKTIILKPGETISFDAGAINNKMESIVYDATAGGATAGELLIISVT